MNRLLKMLLMFAMIWVARDGLAQTFPGKPIELIVTATPGSQSDTLMRFIGEEVSKILDAPFVIVNKPSVTGTIGASQAKRASPDGYTLFMGGNTTMAANVHMVKNLQYSPLEDFEPITLITTNPLVLVVRADLPIRSVGELIEYAKSRPGKMNYGVGNAGNKVAVKLLESLTGISTTEIPFKGAAPAMQELIAGRLDFIISDPLVADPFIKEGRIRPLAVTSSGPLAKTYKVPTMKEAVSGYSEIVTFLGFYAPKGTPRPVIDQLHDAFVQAMTTPKSKLNFSRMGMAAKTSTPEELKVLNSDQIDLWAHLVKVSNIQPQ